MPNDLQPVRPGDLITADFMNGLLLKIEELEHRIEAIEGGEVLDEALAITDLNPPTGPYQQGSTLTVSGRNFEFSLGATRVFLNGVRVLTLGSGSSDTRLVFTIPPVPGVVEPGTPVTLRVTNSSEEATRQIVLRPAPVVLFGDVDVDWLAVNPTTIQPDQPATFQFRIRSRASADASFLIDPFVTVASGQSVWQSRLQVLDSSLEMLSGRSIHLIPLEEKLFHVRLSSVPSSTDGVDFQLVVNATSGGVSGTSGALSFQVGQTTEPPDTTITLNPTALIGSGTLAGDTVTVAAGQSPRVRFRVTFAQPGTYNLTVTPPPQGSGWTVQKFAATPASYKIESGDIGASGFAQRFPEITVQPGVGAAASATCAVHYQRDGDSGSSGRSFPLNLSLGT